MTTEMEDAVLNLPVEERAQLARKLLASLEPLEESEFDRAWGEESARRVAAGAGQSVPGEMVAAKARALLR